MKVRHYSAKYLVPRAVAGVTATAFLCGWVYSAVHIWSSSGTAFVGFPLWFWRYGSVCSTIARCNFDVHTFMIDIAVTLAVPFVFYELTKWVLRNYPSSREYH